MTVVEWTEGEEGIEEEESKQSVIRINAVDFITGIVISQVAVQYHQ